MVRLVSGYRLLNFHGNCKFSIKGQNEDYIDFKAFIYAKLVVKK